MKLTYKQRIDEYKTKIIEIKNSIKRYDCYCFSDGRSMYGWYTRERGFKNKYIEDIDNLDEDRKEQIRLFIELEIFQNRLLEINNKRKFEEKIKGYIYDVLKLKRNILQSDNLFFSDGTEKYSFYRQNIYTIIRERENNIIPDKDRMNEIQAFAQIDNYLYEIEKIVFRLKSKEYKDRLLKLNSLITNNEHNKFLDGTPMAVWYDLESNKIEEEREKELPLTEERMKEIQIFANIDNLIYDIANKIYYKRVDEYLKKVKKLDRLINQYEVYYFSDSKSMQYWHRKETSKLYYERENNIIPDEERMNEIQAFAQIDNYLYDLKKSKN